MKLSENPRRVLIRVGGTLLVLALSAGILGFLVYSQREALSGLTLEITLFPILLAFILFSLDLGLVASIWGSIMNTLGEKLGIWQHIRIYCISNLAKRIPGTIWYIASRAQIYQREGIARRLTAGASGVEFAVSTLSCAMVSLVFGISILAENRLNLLGLALLLGLSLAASHPRIIGWVFRRTGVPAQEFTRGELLRWVLAYILAWILSGIVVFTVGRIFIEIDLKDLWFVIGSVSVANIITALLFFAPTNLGITEVSLSLLLTRIMPAPYAVLISVATRFLIISFEAFWAVICIWLNKETTT